MPLFGNHKAAKLDDRLELVWIRPVEHRKLDAMMKRLLGIQKQLLTEAFRGNDEPQLLAVGWNEGGGLGNVLLVTRKRVIEFSRTGRIMKKFQTRHVAKVEVIKGSRGSAVKIVHQDVVDSDVPTSLERAGYICTIAYPDIWVARTIGDRIRLLSPLL